MPGPYRRSPNVVCRQVGAESVLVPIRQNVGDLDFVYTLSPVAARVWSMLDGKNEVDEIVNAICDEYDVDATTASSDLSELLSDLSDAALISQVSPS